MKSTCFYFALCFLSLFATPVYSASLLFEDPFYQKEWVNEVLENKGNYQSAYYTPLAQTELFSSHPIVQSLWRLCVGSLGQPFIEDQNRWAPFLAEQIEREKTRGGYLYKISLKKGIQWQPLKPSEASGPARSEIFSKPKDLTAYDFKLLWEILHNPYYEAEGLAIWRKKFAWMETFRVLDDLHFEITTFSQDVSQQDEALMELIPLPSHIFLSHLDGSCLFEPSQNLSLSRKFAQGLKNHWATHLIPSCGPWKIESLRSDEVVLVPNTHFPIAYRALFDRMTLTLKHSEATAWQAFKAGELDSHFLTPFQWRDYEHFMASKGYQQQRSKGNAIEKYEYLAPHYYFIGWNQKHALFKEQKIRLAMSHAVPYEFIIKNILKGFAKRLSGPFMPTEKIYDPTLPLLEFDLSTSLALLEEMGFKKDAKTGQLVHQKSQEPFSFTLLYYRPNETAALICQCIASTLKELGIHCELVGENYEGFMQKASNHTFDALFMAWSIGKPVENLEDIWKTDHGEPAPLNFIQFDHPEVNALIDQLKPLQNTQEKEERARKIHYLLYLEQPYTFLYLPKQIFVYRSYLKNVVLPKEDIKPPSGEADLSPQPKVFYFSKTPDEKISAL